jgi:hypothetical protein
LHCFLSARIFRGYSSRDLYFLISCWETSWDVELDRS